MKTILVIEDNQDIAATLSIRLRAAGYEVALAYDGVSGINTASKMRPDLIVMDISMPGGSGLLTAKRMRRMAPLACTPIIFVTARTDADLRDQAMTLGAVGFFEKPFEARELLEAIEEALDEGRSKKIA